MTEPTAELLACMAEFGLTPPAIEWDGKMHRFPSVGERGRSGSGWYIAYADMPPSAAFGCWKTGVKETWTLSKEARPDDFDPKAHREAWEATKREREAELVRIQEEVAATCRASWEAAAPASPDHPYLQTKGITDPAGLKQDGDTLLVPMKGVEDGNPLVSLQTIRPGGVKLFTEGGRVAGTRTTIGGAAFKKGGPLYLCEGWATGWSIHQATGAPVLVAFSAGNLHAVAEYARDNLPAQLVIAADNDRWTELRRNGGTVPNPGVTIAREVGEALGVPVAIPDFADPSSKPTDFNDLHRLEGLEAVRRWLDPARAAEATTVVGQEEEGPAPVEPPAPHPEAPIPGVPGADAENGEAPPDPAEDEAGPPDESWLASAPFRPIGFDRGTYFYLPRGTGQIVPLSAAGHRRESLLTMAPLSWWQMHFPASNGIAWATAADALFRACERVGVFRPERLRGRGLWPTETEAGERGHVLHLGDRLLPPGARAFVDPEDYHDPEGHIYERSMRLAGPSKKRSLPLHEAGDVLDLFTDLLWHDPASGHLLAGWTVLAPLCGALRWRPHVWITGDAGSGKSSTLERLVVPLTGGMSRYFEGASSEAGMRQRLSSDGLPVIYDEAEKQDARSDDRIQNVLQLARSASSSGGAEVVKGTTHGKAMSFSIRSMFCLASIGGALRQEADKTRVSLLQLHGPSSMDPDARRAHWERYRPKLDRVTLDLGRELIGRSLGWLRDGRLLEAVEIFCSEAAVVLGDTRSGDQYGTLYAGAWTLMSDDVPTRTEARELVGGEDLGEYIAEQVPAGRKALDVILQRRERLDTADGPRTYTVGEMVGACVGRAGKLSKEDADGFLRQVGVRVDVEEGGYVLLFATTSEWIRKALAETPYSDSLHTALRTLQGVEPGGSTYFNPGLTSRTTKVPLAVVGI